MRTTLASDAARSGRLISAALLVTLGAVLPVVILSVFGSGGEAAIEGTRSVVVNAAVQEPAASEPAASEPAASEPAASEPAASEPPVSEPAASTADFDTAPSWSEDYSADADPAASAAPSTSRSEGGESEGAGELPPASFVPLGGSPAVTSGAAALGQALGDDEGKVKVKVKWLDEQGIKVEVVTELFVEAGDTVVSGDQLIEVSGRPIFVFEGVVPATRSLEFGDSGADVAQLEAALGALGYGVGAHDGVYDGGLASGLAAFYADNGYSLPEPSSGDLADVRDLQADLAELDAERQQLVLELDDETKWGVTDDGFQKREEAQLKIQAHNDRIARFRTRLNPFLADQARIATLINAIQGSYASGNFGFLDTDDLPVDLQTEFRRLSGDDTDEFLTIDALIDELNGELAKVRDDVADIENDIEDEFDDLAVSESEFSQLERERYHIEDSSKADDIRLDIEKVYIKVERKQADLAAAQEKLVAELVIDEFVFVPGLPGTIDEVKVGLRDPADDGTLLEIVTGDNGDSDSESDGGDAETEVTADGEVAVEDEEVPAEDPADDPAQDEPAEEG